MRQVSGWFAVSRGILEHPIFEGRPDRLYAWVWIIANAAYRDTKQDVCGQIVPVPRGSLCASQASLQAGTGMSRQSLRTFISLLKNENMISTTPATKATKARTMVTICNYDKYQANQPAINQQPTKEQPNINQTSTNKSNKETNKQINNTPIPPSGDAVAAKILSEVCSSDVAADFIAHRRALKSPMTEVAAKRIAKKLKGHASPDAVLSQSIENGWRGVFPDKVGAKQANFFEKKSGKPVDNAQRLKNIAMMIERRIPSAVTAGQARECIQAGLVTTEQCRGLGLL